MESPRGVAALCLIGTPEIRLRLASLIGEPVPTCSGEVYRRGLCQACHKSAQRLVARRKSTWGELERMGLAKPGQRGASCTNPLRLAFAVLRSVPIETPVQPCKAAAVRPDNSSARVWSGLINSLNGAAA